MALETLFTDLVAMLRRDGSAALVTVLDVQGSGPRDSGARMLVRADGAFSGSIGGGALEWRALAEAQALLAGAGTKTARYLDQALGPDLGQCCGGRVRVLIERFDRSDEPWLTPLTSAERAGPFRTTGEATAGGHFRRALAAEDGAQGGPIARLSAGRLEERFGQPATPVLVAGAGHVGRALVLALAPLPFAVDWIDPRQDAFPGFAPANVRPRVGSPVEALASLPRGAFILAMTHSHGLDLEIAHAALAAERFALVGVIGSATKRARFVSQLRQGRLAEPLIDRLVCPIGIPGLGGKEPAVIAASVTAQLLVERARLAGVSGSARKEDSRHVG